MPQRIGIIVWLDRCSLGHHADKQKISGRCMWLCDCELINTFNQIQKYCWSVTNKNQSQSLMNEHTTLNIYHCCVFNFMGNVLSYISKTTQNQLLNKSEMEKQCLEKVSTLRNLTVFQIIFSHLYIKLLTINESSWWKSSLNSTYVLVSNYVCMIAFLKFQNTSCIY